MIESDPILEAWKKARERAANHPLTLVEISVAAFNGAFGLDNRQRAHLLESRCPICEPRLRQAWQHRCPPDLVLEGLRSFPVTGAFGAALRDHVEGCLSSRCQEALAEASSAVGESEQLERPPKLPSRLWDAIAPRLEAWGATIAVARPASLAPARGRRPSRQPKARRFGHGVSLSALPGRSSVFELRLLRDQIERPHDGPVLVSVVGSDGTILAEQVVDLARTVSTAEMEIGDGAPLRDGTIVILAWQRERPA
jgi:hypothetical protein